MKKSTQLFLTGSTLALLSLPTTAWAQCYKGLCDRLDIDAVGANFESFEVRADEGRSSFTGTGVSGGDIAVDYVGNTPWGPCTGYATVLPDHIIDVRQDPAEVTIDVRGQGDTVLILQGPEGWICNDDAVGSDPQIQAVLDPGRYRVWVASYRPGHHEYDLRVSAGVGVDQRPPPPPPPPAYRGELDAASARARFDSITLDDSAIGAALQTEGEAGGRVDVSYLGVTDSGACVGFAEEEPSHIVTLTERMDDFRFAVQSPGDTTLVVHGPHGWLCNDDAVGQDPVIEGSFPPGTYRVWVGSYDPERGGPYTLGLVSAAEAPCVEGWEFSGRFESLDVAFTGRTIEELAAACTSFASSSSALRTGVDDVTVFGATFRNTFSWWSPASLCAIAALNARPVDPRTPMLVEGNIEGTPFALWGDPATASQTARRFIPTATDGANIDDLVVNGRSFHNQSSWWSAEQVAALVGWLMPDPMATWFAEGDMEGIPFVFAGNSAAEVGQQCNRFWAEVVSDTWVDDMTVNGQPRHNDWGWWEPTDACMIVSSLATRR